MRIRHTRWKGMINENRVVEELIQKKFQIINRNLKIFGVEFDIAVRPPQKSEIWFLEVKSFTPRSNYQWLNPYQKDKQKRSLQAFSDLHPNLRIRYFLVLTHQKKSYWMEVSLFD